MALEGLLLGLQRAPWSSVARHILSRAGYERRLGAEKTRIDILGQKLDPAKEAALRAGLIEHCVAGEKLIQLVQLAPAEKKKVDQWIKSKRIYANDLTKPFPGSAPHGVLPPHCNSDPTSAGHASLIDGDAAIYTAARTYVKAVPVPATSLKPTAAAGFERIVGYKRTFVQTYDAIWLPQGGDFVVLSIDLPKDVQKSEFAAASLTYLTAQLRHELGRPLKVANFWHAIDGLYKSPSGKMVDYGFSAGGQSVNNHRARRKGTVCLRSAVYDAAGAQAVTNAGASLELFKIAVEWTRKHPDNIITSPEVLIPGKAHDLNKALPVVSYCIVRDCIDSSDLRFVVDQLAPLINNWI